jgi:hypothetical protein
VTVAFGVPVPERSVSSAYGCATTAGASVAAAAVPVRLTVGAGVKPVPLMVSEAEELPGVAGLYATLMVQLFPAETEFPQLWVALKSPAFVPVGAMLVMFKFAPVTVSVTVLGLLVVPTVWESKVKVGGLNVTVWEYANVAENRFKSKARKQKTRSFVISPPEVVMSSMVFRGPSTKIRPEPTAPARPPK